MADGDEDHAPRLWTSVATTFKSDPAVIFDLFNEPYIGNSIGYLTDEPDGLNALGMLA